MHEKDFLGLTEGSAGLMSVDRKQPYQGSTFMIKCSLRYVSFSISLIIYKRAGCLDDVFLNEGSDTDLHARGVAQPYDFDWQAQFLMNLYSACFSKGRRLDLFELGLIPDA
ncbi:hypothetical protein XU18_0863 [Perkinsela sp. CCAP 1560/4]|nr:hypothetical protein XU18_0863 [Perkinsela sp. CCAP 1560/4]|eukprot:KNH08666.1 hypothetical protein XU18_0863 [Perkinsela sp. CCAP 1560/4]